MVIFAGVGHIVVCPESATGGSQGPQEERSAMRATAMLSADTSGGRGRSAPVR